MLISFACGDRKFYRLKKGQEIIKLDQEYYEDLSELHTSTGLVEADHFLEFQAHNTQKSKAVYDSVEDKCYCISAELSELVVDEQ